MEMSRLCSSLSFRLRAIWLLFLIIAIAIAYTIDSRVEVQLYEPSCTGQCFAKLRSLVGSPRFALSLLLLSDPVGSPLIAPASLASDACFARLTFARSIITTHSRRSCSTAHNRPSSLQARLVGAYSTATATARCRSGDCDDGVRYKSRSAEVAADGVDTLHRRRFDSEAMAAGSQRDTCAC